MTQQEQVGWPQPPQGGADGASQQPDFNNPGWIQTQRLARALAEVGFWQSVALAGADECWLWLGPHRTKDGYGKWVVWPAHRFAWECWFRTSLKRRVIHHTCREKLCVNPAHLAALSARDHGRIHRHGALAW